MVSNISIQNKLILLCSRLTLESPQEQALSNILTSQLNWEKLINTANQYGVLPFIYYNLNKINAQAIIPSDIFQNMKNTYYANLARNALIEKEISTISELADRKNIKFIPFRGFGMVQQIYQNPGLRIMSDIDILINPSDLEEIKKIFRGLHYSQTVEESQDYITVFSKNMGSNNNLFVEAHSILSQPRPYKIVLPCLWQRAIRKDVFGRNLLLLSPEDILLSIALHIRRHTRRLDLKFAIDTTELLNMYKDKLDWQYVQKSARDNHIIICVYFMLYFAKELLGAKIPIEILNKFKPNMLKELFIKLTINKGNFFDMKKWQGIFLRFLLFDGLCDFFFYVWRVSFLERLMRRYTARPANINIDKAKK